MFCVYLFVFKKSVILVGGQEVSFCRCPMIIINALIFFFNKLFFFLGSTVRVDKL